MQRCFDLARQGAGMVSPNPMVGSVVVHDHRIIGEGFHAGYGGPHAERNAINSVAEKHLLRHASLYVSLEPCCHYGRTPPCTDLVLMSGIRKIYISMKDPNPVVSGKGIAMLRSNGVEVYPQILEREGFELIRFFHTFMTRHRPYIILKIVQSADGFLGQEGKQVWLSNEYERIMVHKLRSETDAILVGTNTVVTDDPELTTRYYPGKNPMRVILDRTGRIDAASHVFEDNAEVLHFTQPGESKVHASHVETINCAFDETFPERILRELYLRRKQSLLIEGGALLINTFLKNGLWDEAIVVRTPKVLGSGIKAPLIEGNLRSREMIGCDEVVMIRK